VKAFLIALLLFLLLSAACLSSSFAGPPEEGSPQPARITVVETIYRGGTCGYLIQFMSFLALVLGVVSLAQSTVLKSPELPLSAKLLPSLAGLSFLLGVWGASSSYIRAYMEISRLGAVPFENYMRAQANVALLVLMGTAAASLYILFYVISLIRFERSKKKSA